MKDAGREGTAPAATEHETVRIHPVSTPEAATHPNVPRFSPAPAAAGGWALRFLSGPHAGSQLALQGRTEFVFGRGREADVMLAEDLVSRRHAVLSLAGDAPSICDLGSTNGTFVNGERVSKAAVKAGDRLLIGTSIARLVAVGEEEETTKVGQDRGLLERERRQGPGSTMAGRLEEVPLVDLLQLFSNSRKSGSIVARSADGLDGEVTLRTGQIVSARIEGKPHLTHRKALARLMRIAEGAFEFLPPPRQSEAPVPNELNESTELLLMDSLRLTDELVALEPQLPPADTELVLARPLPGRLRALEPAQLDALQLVLEHPRFGDAIDHSPLHDVDAARAVMQLVGLGFVQPK